MLKALILISSSLFFGLPIVAQFLVSNILPVAMHGDPYADTLLNTSALMKREGIKKVIAKQTSDKITGTYNSKTAYLNEHGNISACTICFPGLKRVSPGSCMGDTFLYNSRGLMIEMSSKDVKEPYLRIIAEYTGEREVKYRTIAKTVPDTMIDYKFYNEKGQLVRLKQIRKGIEADDMRLYYNADGFVDSINHRNPHWGTFLFTRKESRKTKQIEMENANSKYEWIFNQSGQCISTKMAWNKQHVRGQSRSSYKTELEIKYFYNPDGTLAEVTNKTTGKPKVTFRYSYEK